MKATNLIIIGGGAVALLYFLKNRKDNTISIVKPKETMPTTGGVTTGGATAGTSQVTSFPTLPESNEPEQVFGLGLPTGMDLPILTAGTGIPTEVAIQQGGVITKPQPALIIPRPRPRPIEPIEPIEPIRQPAPILPIIPKPIEPIYDPAPIQPIDYIIEPIEPIRQPAPILPIIPKPIYPIYDPAPIKPIDYIIEPINRNTDYVMTRPVWENQSKYELAEM